MNTKQLKKDIGKSFHLLPRVRQVTRTRPPGVVVLTSGEPLYQTEIVETDYLWRLEEVNDGSVTLYCSHTGHKIILGADNVREFRTPDFLMLRCQLTLAGDRIKIEPF
jgi:hypothetical protein